MLNGRRDRQAISGGSPLRSHRLQTALAGHKPNLNTALYCRCDAVEHGERMAFVICVLEPGNHGLGGADAAGKLNLGGAGALAKLKNLMGDFSIGDFLLRSEER